MTSPDEIPTTPLEPRTLVWLRWIGLFGLIALVAVGPELGFAPPIALAVTVAAAGALTNLAVTWAAPRSDGPVTAVLVLDTLLLTALLAASGGASNPFVVLYGFPVVLGALALAPGPTAALFGVATVAYGSLFWVEQGHLHHGPAAMRVHVLGMFVAYLLTAATTATLVHRVRRAQAAATRELAHADAMRERAERLTSLATLAAGAAHELGTPLSTILLATGELERALPDPAAQRDLALIRNEVQRCREIVGAMSADGGVAAGEGAVWIGTRDLVDEALEGTAWQVEVEADDDEIRVPVRLAGQVLRQLVNNAADAGGEPVRVVAARRDGGLSVVVRDRGPGMPPEVLARATEPFFTTKAPGAGRGLGLFFVASAVQQLGGTFELHSGPDGTEAKVWIPSLGAQ